MPCALKWRRSVHVRVRQTAPSRRLLSIGVFLSAALTSSGALAERDGKYLYVLTCSGCHRMEGSASREGRVPALAGSIGHFMKTPEARNFLPQAPGIMTSGLNDRDVQALMNWMVPALAGSSLSETFQPYSLDEMAGRAKPNRTISLPRARRSRSSSRIWATTWRPTERSHPLRRPTSSCHLNQLQNHF